MTENLCWVAPAFRGEPDAEAWANHLASMCEWDLDDFGADYPWSAPIPPRERWDAEVAALNEHLRKLLT